MSLSSEQSSEKSVTLMDDLGWLNPIFLKNGVQHKNGTCRFHNAHRDMQINHASHPYGGGPTITDLRGCLSSQSRRRKMHFLVSIFDLYTMKKAVKFTSKI